MGAIVPPNEPVQRRVKNTREAVLGISKKQSLEESRRCPQCAQPVCLEGCPLGIDIPGFIRLLREGDVTSGAKRIKEQNPFPGILGRVCHAPCQDACIFYEEGSPIGIRALERFAADQGKVNTAKDPQVVSKGKRVAIVGSGPAGLSAAWSLAKEGLGVTIFESMAEPGGILRYGIPEFRLPQQVLDAELNQLKVMGVDFQTNVFIGRMMTIEDIWAKGFAAVLLAVGASAPRFSLLPGDHLGGVYYAQEFLMRALALGKSEALVTASFMPAPMQVVIIGNGHGAFDAARLARRLGKQVSILFAGLEEELQVPLEEMKLAQDEGVKVQSLVEVVEIAGSPDGWVTAVKCRHLDLLEHDGRLKLEAVAGSEFLQEAHTVILANGQVPNNFLSHSIPGLQWSADGALRVDPLTQMTSVEHVFAAGDVTSGPTSIVQAMAAGKKAAACIMGHVKA